MRGFFLGLFCSLSVASAGDMPGATGRIGAGDGAKHVTRLRITRPGVYSGFIVDGKWKDGNLVKITSPGVILRNCEIHSGTGNAIGVFAKGVIIENCLIHHMLAGTFAEQEDAHGITGHWGDVVIRNCVIHHVSGDSVQFDPGRASSGKLVIENCTFWTGPLPADAAGFRKGERPGENAFDSKTKPDGERCPLTVRDCYFHGWTQPGQIGNLAALNLKENIDAEISGCVFRGNEIAFRIRGPGKRGGAKVSIEGCSVYDCGTGVRMEEKVEGLRITGLAFGDGVGKKFRSVNGGAGPGFSNSGEKQAPPFPAGLENP